MSYLQTTDEPLKEASFKSKVLLSLFLFVFFSMGTSFFCFMSYSLFKEISSYLWDKTECTVISSSIEEMGTGGHSLYSFKGVYSYSKKGRDYKSDKVSLQYGGSSKYNDAQKLLNKFPAGSKGVCHVNPSNPAEAVLTHNPSQLLMLPFIAIPLLFIIIGGGGIYGIWSRKNLAEIIKKNKRGIGRKIPKTLLSLFFSAFLLIGLSTFYSMGIQPALQLLQSEKWQTIPCLIISSSVGSHYGDDGTTYSVDILYSYNINGREYRANTYSFIGGKLERIRGEKENCKFVSARNEHGMLRKPGIPGRCSIEP